MNYYPQIFLLMNMVKLKNLKIPAPIHWRLERFKANNRCVTFGSAIEELLDRNEELDKLKTEIDPALHKWENRQEKESKA